MFIVTCLSYWSDIMGGGSCVWPLDDVPEPCVWRGLSNSKSRCLEAIQRELVRQNVLPDVLDVPESSLVTREQWWLRWLGRSVTAVDPNSGKLDFYLKGHLLVIPLLFKGKTIQNLVTSMLSYELILSNIFMEMSFRVFCGWIEGGWRHKSVGGVVRTYVQCTLYMYLLPY